MPVEEAHELARPPYRILPRLTAANRPFWTGGAEGRLLVDRCADCGTWAHPALPVCRACGSRAVAPAAASGRGTVVTYTINHQRWSPTVADDPYVVALVELDEQPGLRILTNLVDVRPDDVSIGLRVGVRFLEIEDIALPVFAPEAA